jgi:hypothetical protein
MASCSKSNSGRKRERDVWQHFQMVVWLNDTGSVIQPNHAGNVSDMSPAMKQFKLLSSRLLQSNVSSSISVDTPVDCTLDQLNQYIREIQQSVYAVPNEPLTFWQNRQFTTPKLSTLAEDLISMPASQAYVERLFLCVAC